MTTTEAITQPVSLSYTRREWMVMRAIKRGAKFSAAIIAVEKAMTANPAWNDDDVKTYAEWEANRT